jgi:16S rRNA (guanine(966)-N(2))-methyltransferase RsmD
MRIIAGEYRGRVLKSPAGIKTRPTSDRLRETLFNIISPRIGHETRFLDLCSGTGAVGIEALSRGAGSATFVDRSRRACALIETNLDLLQVPESVTEVVCDTSESFVGREHPVPWDIIFFDPPYSHDYRPVMHRIGFSDHDVLGRSSLLVTEHHLKAGIPDAIGGLRRWRIVRQGESCLSFYELS